MSKNIDKKLNGRKNYKEKAKLNNTVIGGGIGIDGVAYNPSFLIAKGEEEENAVQKKH